MGFIQLATELAYLLLAVVAIYAAIRWPERARVDIALLFGAVGVAVLIQEIGRSPGAEALPDAQLAAIPVLAIPYLLLRLVDHFQDVPRWLLGSVLVGYFPLAAASLAASQPTPLPIVLAATIYLVAGILYAAWAFAARARATAGITARRLWAAAAGALLLAAVFVLSAVARMHQPFAGGTQLLSQVAGLLSGLSFYAAFFPPSVLRRAWRLPELLAYLRETRWSEEGPTVAPDCQDTAPDSLALDRVCAHVARTTGAQRALLALEDPVQGDLVIWGAPSARLARGAGLIGRAITTGRPQFARRIDAAEIDRPVRALFDAASPPRSALVAPVVAHGRAVGALAVYGDKGPIFVEDDLEVLTFFASEASAILRERQHRETAQELAALREADRLKNEFMAVISHELRTPLTAISGYADILLRGLSGPLTERQERQIAATRDATRRLLALINDLLDVSKLEAGTLQLHLAPVDAAEAVRRAVASTRVLAANKAVSLVVTPPPDPAPCVQADDERLQQILVNLITNGIKFTPPGGMVSVGTRLEDGSVVFTVSDTGVGIPPHEVGRIWRRFYQVDSSFNRQVSGAGLGLSIVQRLVQLHGGTCEAASPGPGAGSTFTVRLPLAQPGPPAQPLSAPGDPPLAVSADVAALAGSPRRGQPRGAAPLVLVVEDDEDIAAVLRAYLEEDGYQVEVARDGYQALQAARARHPHAITLDVMLPKLDGWSVLNTLKHDPMTADIPVVVLSVVDNQEFGFVLGAREYLVKPIHYGRLRAALERVAEDAAGPANSVLIVDDDPAMRDMLGTALAADGWSVRAVADGQSALRAVREEPPMAILLDLVLPDMDGFQVLSALRADEGSRSVPVIVVTAKELDERDRSRLARTGQRVILKHAAPLETLRRELSGALARHPTRPTPRHEAADGDRPAPRDEPERRSR